MEKLAYTIHINAAAEKVWTIMLAPDTYKEWTNVSWPGSFYAGNWKLGENIRFISANGSGTLATISRFQPYELLSADHIAILLPGGKEDKESDAAKRWIGIKETYLFTAADNGTHLSIEMLTDPAWIKMFDDGWPGALAKLKEICEKS